MKRLLCSLALLVATTTLFAQRHTDVLDRGLISVAGNGGRLVSWRLFGEEYFNTQFNLYRDGAKVNATPLSVTNYLDASGSDKSVYTVAAVIGGVEQAQSKPALVFTTDGSGNPCYNFDVAPVKDRTGKDVTADYEINDIALADVDGDGVTEFLMKRNCISANFRKKSNTTEFSFLECYKLDGTRLWTIDLGPNMNSGPDEQYDIVGFDWDEDGRAELVMRAADNVVIHTSTGRSITIGDANKNDRRGDDDEYIDRGPEYLLYLDGLTAEPYQIGPAEHPDYMMYPLPRGVASNDYLDDSWGNGILGHRPSKHYFGAPFLDGRHASIFLGRGAYTKIMACAFDVDPLTHALTKRWDWRSDGLDGSWFGQGYHNYAIADVDEDGRDEIVYGSMVLDDNGFGLSTTGLGHGDAQHCGDLDPYRKGLEQFACNEDKPAMNYRNATTSKIYYRVAGGGDDGRALAGNFSNTLPGAQGRTVGVGMISCVADKPIQNCAFDIAWDDLNFRIYWDGDLEDEVYDSPGSQAREGMIVKPGSGRLLTTNGCSTNNSSKNNPCATGDIFGDWREEFIMRTSDNKHVRIYATPYKTTFRNYSLWHDHQYRNAMVWQTMGYNQPPHVSYFMGEMEGITTTPPPYTMTGRTEIANGGCITAAHNGKQTIVCETNDTQISIADGAQPEVAFFNVPTWVQGCNNNAAIATTTYTCTATGGGFAGATRLVKQGDGKLILPAVAMRHSGNTDIWAGTLSYDGAMTQSALWLNRFARLETNGGTFKSLKADYASTVATGDKGFTVNETYTMGFGSRLVLNVYSENLKADQVNIHQLQTEKKTGDAWLTYGPAYLQPVIEIVEHPAAGQTQLAEGDYVLGRVDEVSGNLADIKIEGVTGHKASLHLTDNGQLILSIAAMREPAETVWTGSENGNWDFAKSNNFRLLDDPDLAPDFFVNGDKVNFTDEATRNRITLTDDLSTEEVIVNAAQNYTFSGNGSIIAGSLTKQGSGTLTIATDNSYKGGNHIRGGVVSVSSLANENKAKGNLGAVTNSAAQFTLEDGATLQNTAVVTNGSPMKMMGDGGGVLDCGDGFTQNKSVSGTLLTKKGGGWLTLNATGGSLNKLVIAGGNVACNAAPAAKTVELRGGNLNDNQGSSETLFVDQNQSGTFTTANRQSYSNKITGQGTITIIGALEKGSNYYATRTPLSLNFTGFTGTLVPKCGYADDGRFTLDTGNGMPSGTLNIAEGVTVMNSSKTFAIGTLTGKGKLGGACTFSNSTTPGTNTWNVGCDEDFTFAGIFTSGDRFNKVGNGQMTVTGIWTSTGTVSVNGGTLLLKTGAQLGTGSLTIAKDGTLLGATKAGTPLTNSTVTVNGTLQPGTTADAVMGEIDFDGHNVSLNATSRLVFGLRKPAAGASIRNAYIKHIGTLKVASGATIAPFLMDGIVLTTNSAQVDSFYVWTNVSKVTWSEGAKMELPALPVYNYWDTSRISEGVLYVRCDDEKYADYLNGITALTSNEPITATITDAHGVELGTLNTTERTLRRDFARTRHPKGVYLIHFKGKTVKIKN